jgi:hypothetical protein
MTVMLGLLSVLWSAGWAWYYDLGPLQHDVDSWAIKITNTYPQHLPAIELVRNPSLWKGPIIPTIYHASYVIWPSVYSPIFVNILSFAASAMLLHRLFIAAGLHPVAVTWGIFGWIIYPAYRYHYAMYYAEPVVTLLSSWLLWLIVQRPQRDLSSGLLAGILLLARPPFLIVIGLIPFAMWIQGRRKNAFAFAAGAAITFLPWGIRNLIVHGTYVPLTVEGGQTLFHGSYLPLDNVHWQEFRDDPAVAKILSLAPKDPIERMNYLAAIAKRQVLEDPSGQFVRCLRKAQRFWMNVEPDSFIPHRNTGVPMALMLPLAVIGAVRNRRLPIVTWMGIWILGLWAMHAAVFGINRYSYPVFPLAATLAASVIWRSQTIPASD